MNQAEGNETRLILGILILKYSLYNFSYYFLNALLLHETVDIKSFNVWIDIICLAFGAFILIYNNKITGSILIIIGKIFFIVATLVLRYINSLDQQTQNNLLTKPESIAHSLTLLGFLVDFCVLILGIWSIKRNSIYITLGVYFIVMGLSYGFFAIISEVITMGIMETTLHPYNMAYYICSMLFRVTIGIVIIAERKKKFPLIAIILCGIDIYMFLINAFVIIFRYYIETAENGLFDGIYYNASILIYTADSIVLPLLAFIFLFTLKGRGTFKE